MPDPSSALPRLLEGRATSEDLESLRQALTRGEISIGGDATGSIILIGSGNTVTLTAEARALLQPETPAEEPAPGESPYQGLLYFDVDDAPPFFGREALTRALLDRLSREPLLAIVGASGGGKSSLARAGLADLILNDVGEEPGALPLLSHALLETWKRRRGRTLTLQGYAEAGGVKQAIARTAEGVYGGLNERERALARALFLRLTELGEGAPDTRRRASLEELTAEGADAESLRRLLRTLTDARLLTTAAEGVEVAHEALIREWETLRRWEDEDRAALRALRGVTAAAAEWERSGRDPAYLVHRAGRLEDALSLRAHPILRLSPLEDAYLTACRDLQENERRARERRLRWTVTAALSAALAFLLLGGFGFWQSRVAQEQARVTLARQMSAEALEIFIKRGSDQPDALRLAAHSMRLYPNRQAAQVLQEHTLPPLVARMTHDDWVYSVAFSPDGRWVVSGRADGTARVWEAATGREVSRMTHEDEVWSVAFSPDGRYVASGSWDGTIIIAVYRPEDLIADACARVSRNLTREEWAQYIGDLLPYQAVCLNLPLP